MEKVRWNLINDVEFVHLCSELLSHLGFTDVQIQGDGPDGGIDLFATEPLKFAIGGTRPHRWAIQCKFSLEGTRRSVSDQEVRDVEGIMRSDRFSIQAARGYMLLTNRRVTQNVVERLAGIDRHSSFRTCYLDGLKLEHLLLDYPAILSKYFLSLAIQEKLHLGPPIVELAGISQPKMHFPEFKVELTSPIDPKAKVLVRAILDSGAAVSAMPKEAIEQLQLRDYDMVLLSSGSGELLHIKRYLVNLNIGV